MNTGSNASPTGAGLNNGPNQYNSTMEADSNAYQNNNTAATGVQKKGPYKGMDKRQQSWTLGGKALPQNL